MNKKHILISCILPCLLVIPGVVFYFGIKKYQSSKIIEFQNAAIWREFEENYNDFDNVCFAQRKYFHIAKSSSTAVSEYQILQVLKGTEISVGDQLLLQYWNDSPSSPFDFFISDQSKEFALIFISNDTLVLQNEIGKVKTYRVEGDSFITYFLDRRDREYMEDFFSKLSPNDNANLSMLNGYIEINGRRLEPRK